MFVGRSAELKKISRRLRLDSFQSILVYGRRRIGKTELIDEAIRKSGQSSLVYLARKVSFKAQLDEFSSLAGEFMGIIGFHPRNLEELLRALFSYSCNHPFILFIDEYPYLRGDDPGIDSIFQRIMHEFENRAKMSLILCGSYMDIMMKVFDKEAPLYGRFNEIIHLRPFDYLESSYFYSSLSQIDKFKYYACFGGTAFNLKNLDYSLSFEENLLDNFIEIDSFFDKEAVSTVASELIKEENTNTVFELIASGKKNYNELNQALGDPSKDNATRYLQRLEEMDLIGKSYSINANSKKKPLYYINDNFLDFYYTFLSRRPRERFVLSSKQFYLNYVKEKLQKEYLPRKFEELTKEYCIRRNKLGQFPFLATNMGRLFFRGSVNGEMVDREFDLVMNTNEGYVPVECKYTKGPINMSVINEEKEQWSGLPFKIKQFGFASKSGFDEKVKEQKDLLLFELNEMFDLKIDE